MLASNPLEADRYKDSFDPEKKEMRQFFSEVREKENRQKAVLQFYAEIPEYAKVDTPEVSATFKARMAEAGRSITADNLKLTYYELRAAGKIPDPPAETTERPKAPPPSPSGGSRPRSTRNNELAKAEAMTKEELREYIHKLEREGAPAR